MADGDKDQGVAAQFTGLDVKEAIKLKTDILNSAKQIKQEQMNNDGKASLTGGIYVGPSDKVISGDYKKSIENNSGK